MTDLLKRIAWCVEHGKVNAHTPYPPELRGEDGADELTKKALSSGMSPSEVLTSGLMAGMEAIGIKFRDNLVYIPQVLMAARAMNAGMEHLKPHFSSGEVKRRGTFIIGTVAGDLHDIGKNLVSIMVSGGGWEVVDLGTDVSAEKFLRAAEGHPGCAVGISALLTTTMLNMESAIRELKSHDGRIRCIVGGAPLNPEFARAIGADAYSPDPQGALDFLKAAR
jgi:methanogenic corrinoid protein MtbC1